MRFNLKVDNWFWVFALKVEQINLSCKFFQNTIFTLKWQVSLPYVDFYLDFLTFTLRRDNKRSEVFDKNAWSAKFPLFRR